MTNENASDDTITDRDTSDHDTGSSTDAGAAPPARRRSRRATSAVTTPKREESAQTGPDEGADDASTGDSLTGDAPTKKSTRSAGSTSAKKSSARSAAKKSAAAGADELDVDAGPDQDGTRARSGGGRRRKSSDTSAQGPGSDEGTAPEAATEDVEPAQEGSGARKAPRSAAKKSGSKKAKATEQSDAGDAGTTPAEGADVDQSGAQDPGTGSNPRLATTALLFQPPEPTRTRRRAQSPAGPPRADEADDDADDETEDEEQLDETSSGAARPGADDAADDAADDETGGDDDDTQGDERGAGAPRRRRRRGGRGRRGRSGSGQGGGSAESEGSGDQPDDDRSDEGDGQDGESEASQDENGGSGGSGEGTSSSSRRRRRRRRGSRGDSSDGNGNGNGRSRSGRGDEVTALKGSTRLEAKRQRRREGRDAGRRRTVVTESEFLARRESVDRAMIVRESDGRVQIAVLEDGVLVEHFVSRSAQNGQASMAGNVYLGRVQNVLPSMEAAFVDVGKGRNAVLYAGEVNWDAAGMEGQPRRIEQALKSGDSVLVQVTKDPIGHKGARLTSQITLAGRYLVYVPGGGMTGISRKLPENERARLKKILREIVPDAAGVIVRTAAEGASEEELRNDVQRLQDQWTAIEKKAGTASAPALLQGEPDLAIRVVRDIFNDDFGSLVVAGDGAWSTISEYVQAMAPDLMAKVSRWEGDGDVFAEHRIDEQLAKGMDRKVWLPSGGSLVIDRTEAMTVVDVNTGKFTGSGGTLEETVTRNNLEAAEEIVRQLRLRDIGGIIVIDFIDMVLESNRDLVLRRLVECLGRDRTKHQVAEVTSLGLVQMTRKRVGQGLVEAFSEPCAHCNGRGFIVHGDPVDPKGSSDDGRSDGQSKRSRRKKPSSSSSSAGVPVLPEARESVKATLATIAAAAAQAHDHGIEPAVALEEGEAEAVADALSEATVPEAVSGDRATDDVADAPVPEAVPEDVPEADAPASGGDQRPVPDHAALADLADSLRSVLASREPATGASASVEAPEEAQESQVGELRTPERGAPERRTPDEGETLI